MCKVLYIGTDVPLPLIPAGDPPAPLSVGELRPEDEIVRQVLAQKHVYVVGSHTGCSCGFAYAEGDELEVEGRESIRQLRQYLEQVQDVAQSVALFACWNGDEGRGALHAVEVTLDFFAPDASAFDLPEGWHASLRR